jgi:chorismate mutase
MSLVAAKKPRSLSMNLTVLFSAFVFSGAAHSAESGLSLSLFQAIDERLGYMEDVALFKAQNQIPIEDIEREEIVLSDAKELAARLGLDPNSMERFFIAQISAAKAIQYRYRAELLTREMPTKSIGLQSNIRPALDRLGSDIVTLFARLLQSQSAMEGESRDRFMSILQARLLADTEREALFDAMLEVRRSQ